MSPPASPGAQACDGREVRPAQPTARPLARNENGKKKPEDGRKKRE